MKHSQGLDSITINLYSYCSHLQVVKSRVFVRFEELLSSATGSNADDFQNAEDSSENGEQGTTAGDHR